MTVSESTRVARSRQDLAELQAQLRDHEVVLAALREEVAELRSLLHRAQREALRRIDELRGVAHGSAAVGLPSGAPVADPVEEVSGGQRPVARAAPMGDAEYRRVVTRIRTLVRTVVPVGSTVAVVTRGDHALVDLDGREGWHLPRCEDGRYAGHHPENSEAAIGHLEDLRSRGARFLLVPVTARWWLEYYEGFRRHLEERYRLLVNRDDACVIFALDSQEDER
jgi:hypothetical protein